MEIQNFQNPKQFYEEENWWDKIKWSEIEYTVKKIQEDILKKSKMRETKKVNNLMRSLVRSDFSKLLAIHKITHENKGKTTPGIDGKIYSTSKEKMDLFNEKFNFRNYRFKPVIIKKIPKRIKNEENWNTKENKSLKSKQIKTRPIGIMTIKDRVMTKLISFALMAKWEPLLESNVMGYRFGKSVHDCIHKLCNELIKGNKIILDADIKNFFENIKHRAILAQTKAFRRIIKKILRIKVIENGKSHKNKRGIIQGNPLSPLLANIALHGMQELFETQLVNGKYIKPKAKVSIIRYADDFIIIAPSRKILENWIIPKLNQFLKKRNLALNQEKTKIVTKKEGFKFLGYSIKQNGKKLIAKPKKKSTTYQKYNDLYIYS